MNHMGIQTGLIIAIFLGLLGVFFSSRSGLRSIQSSRRQASWPERRRQVAAGQRYVGLAIVLLVASVAGVVILFSGNSAQLAVIFTPAPTREQTPTLAPFVTQTVTLLPTSTPVPTEPSTLTPTLEPTSTDTLFPSQTLLPTDTHWPTWTASVSPTATSTPLPTYTPSLTSTRQPTQTLIPTDTHWPVPTLTSTR